MTGITIIGTGHMGSAIAGISAAGGVPVQVVDRSSEKAEVLAEAIGGTAGMLSDDLAGEVVVFAVPYAAMAELVESYADRLVGKIVVDITNPVDFSTMRLLVPPDGSSAQLTAAAVPGARVLKAFNTTFAATLVSGLVGSEPTTVLIAGDDREAKEALIDIVTAGGISALDAGPLSRARELEALGFLQIALASSGVVPWAGGFALVR